MARGGAAEASKPAHHGGRGAVEEGGVSLAAVPQRPGRLVDFGAGTGRWGRRLGEGGGGGGG